MRRIGTLAVVGAIGLAAVACSNGGPAGTTSTPAATTGPAGTTTGPGATSSSGTTSGPQSPAGTSAGSPTPAESPVPTELPVPIESNPPGDIPDSTQFVPFRSAPGGFEIRAPEGWARRTTSSAVSFTSKLNTITISWRQTSMQPTPGAVKSSEVPQLRQSFRAFELVSVQAVTLPGGNAVQVDLHANSDPNAVTGKQYRLDVLRFDFFRNGREASVDLSSPVGSDKVDAWKLISESFRWR
jgi:hypothetical protein